MSVRITADEAAEQIRRHVRHEDAGAPATVEKWALRYAAARLRERLGERSSIAELLESLEVTG